MTSRRSFIWLAILMGLAACSSSSHRAPIEEHGAFIHKKPNLADGSAKKMRHEKDWRPQSYIVQKGDTLYSLAFNYGFDYHELAELNGIKDPNVIQVGQEIRLFPAGSDTIVRSTEVVEAKPVPVSIKEQPKVVKYPYREAAVAQIDKVQQATKGESKANSEIVAKAPPVIKTDNKTQMDSKNIAALAPKPEQNSAEGEEDALEWAMPTNGKLISDFSEAENRKGIDIAGRLGQTILAAASGKVVYSGSGLRGYGKLIIIKHNKTYLSAYAHNDNILVKEGQAIARGQKIAEMGNTDADQVKLHFEVRRLGKPVDPGKYLPLGKS